MVPQRAQPARQEIRRGVKRWREAARRVFSPSFETATSMPAPWARCAAAVPDIEDRHPKPSISASSGSTSPLWPAAPYAGEEARSRQRRASSSLAASGAWRVYACRHQLQAVLTGGRVKGCQEVTVSLNWTPDGASALLLRSVKTADGRCYTEFPPRTSPMRRGP